MGEGYKISFICLRRNYKGARTGVGSSMPRARVSVECQNERVPKYRDLGR